MLLHALEWLLVPWTVCLALAPPYLWFPSGTVQGAWVMFDVLLTMLQAAWWNRASTHGMLGWGIVLLACLGPLLASIVLWGATRRMDTRQSSRRSDRR